jgi:hypothetical protein
MTTFETGLYELLLCFPDGVEEVRLTDQLDSFYGDDGFLVFRDQRWAIAGTRRAATPQAVARVICQLLDPATTAPTKHNGTSRRRPARVLLPAVQARR